MILALIIITIAYLIIISLFILGFDRIPIFNLQDKKPITRISIIIPFRDESNNLDLLLASILQLEYPKNLYEILFIDDSSTDGSAEKISLFIKKNDVDATLLKNEYTSASPKKDAIRLGVKHAKENWIVTTDADCILPKYWLDCYDGYLRNTDYELILGPVLAYNTESFLDRFQSLDMLSLQAVTIGSLGLKKPILCNGANLAYKKSLFTSLNPYKTNDFIASGDDIFFLIKMKKEQPSKIGYLKSALAVVETATQPNRKALMEQRVRWVKKSKHVPSLFAKITSITVLLMNLSLITGLVLILTDSMDKRILFYVFVIKISVDFLLIFKSARFFGKESMMLSYIFGCLVYPLFTAVVAITSSFASYKWKGRKFKA